MPKISRTTLKRPYSSIKQAFVHIQKVEAAYMSLKKEIKALREMGVAIGKQDWNKAMRLWADYAPTQGTGRFRKKYWAPEFKVEVVKRYKQAMKLGITAEDCWRYVGAPGWLCRKWVAAYEKGGAAALVDSRIGHVLPNAISVSAEEEHKVTKEQLADFKDKLSYLLKDNQNPQVEEPEILTLDGEQFEILE